MAFTYSTRCAFRLSYALWSGVAVLPLVAAQVYAKPCTRSAQCETGGVCCENCFPQYACVHVGVDQGSGTSCSGEEACCMSDGTCQAGVDGICCGEEGGVSAGALTTCGVFDCGVRACCVPNATLEEGFCQDLTYYDCLAANGTPQAAGTTCAGLPDTDYPTPDGVPNVCDNCPNDTNGGQYDSGDGDGVGDVCDNCPDDANPLQVNSDPDFWGDICDNCPLVPNFLQEDCNADGEGDACEPPDEQDDDEDGICNLPDNCPDVANPLQENSDTDSYGDACDNCDSIDNEGQENCNYPADDVGDVCEPDCDGDGIPDECDDEPDCDGDGIPDACDVEPDCDGDGIPDACDDQPDCDGDGIPDPCDVEPDCDGDGIPDACDDQPDCDDDGIPNDCDTDIDGDGVSNDADICDFTPVDQIPPDKWVNGQGTLPGDLDGDCDVDDHDLSILNSYKTDPGPCPENDDNNHTDPCCDHCGGFSQTVR